MSAQMPVLKEPGRKRMGSRKLLSILLLLFMALLTVLFFNSSISKISEIQIEGNRFAAREEIGQAAAVVVGDAFFRTSSQAIEGRVMTLPQMEKVTVTKAFPGVVKITVKEYPVVAFELSAHGEMTALLSNGTSVNADNDQLLLVDKPVLSGWSDDDPVKEELTKQLGKMGTKQLSDLSEIIPIPSTAYPDRIVIYTRTKFEVITAVSVLPEKIEALNAVIETQEPGKITMLLADTYVPFHTESSENMDSNQKETTQ
ncbi:FtsQ-type POTRA domain-containing protein [Paenibacillus alkaliterrae]|uniref:cell division protein FtsQ/DivIB n=1 Tax=Paenibacillus alkaliterrae TaxID=320909 RepID=UPI001F15CE2F|nr:FtsQ-type POTRA domain-containing protein [Paenibacillus alkaliterrae]MCF2939312.1 FtsQ-type POTRA domain-containing protein [Paenibacillus alkaliterrae]